MIHLKAIERQKELISKLISNGLRDYQLPLQLALEEEYTIELSLRSFINIIKMILLQSFIRKEAPPFKFNISQDALEHNAKLLESFNYDLNCIIEAHKNIIISPESKLREP